MQRSRADVVIVGGGIAGIVAAIDLLSRGRSVILLDRDAEENFGGLAKESFGGILLVDTPMQRRQGVKDSPELALSDWLDPQRLAPLRRRPPARRGQRARGGSLTHLDAMWNYAAGVRHWRPRKPGHGLSLVPPRSALWLDWRGERIGPMPLVTGLRHARPGGAGLRPGAAVFLAGDEPARSR
jgi:predicted oxidoreductase